MYQIFLLILLLSSFNSYAVIEAYEFKTVEQEETYKELIEELRCLVCQNNNLADSNADLAKDLRAETFELVTQGKDRNQVVDYMVQRYGDFVVYNPPLKSNTILLWFGPFVLVVVVLFFLIRHFKKNMTLESINDDTLAEAKKHLKGGE